MNNQIKEIFGRDSSTYEFSLTSLLFTSFLALIIPNIENPSILHLLFVGMGFVLANILWFLLALLFFKKANGFAFIIAHALAIFFLILNTYHYILFDEHLDLTAVFVAATGVISGEIKIGADNYIAFFKQSSILVACLWAALFVLLLLPFPRTKRSPFLINSILTGGFTVLIGGFVLFPFEENSEQFKTTQAAIPYLSFNKIEPKYPLEKFSLAGVENTRKLEGSQIRHLQKVRKDLLGWQIKSKERPNILFLHLESLRSDMLVPEIMPYLSRWGTSKGEILEQHYSTASNTTTGMYGLLHGLSGTYFQSTPLGDYYPIPLDILKNLGYNMGTYHGKPLDYDGMYSRFFKATRDHDFYTPGPDSARKDAIVLNQVLDDIKSAAPASKPRFDYVKLDTTHWNYSYPKAFEKYTPVIEQDFIITSLFSSHMKSFKSELLNRYKNSSYYMDHIVGNFLDELEDIGYLENSIIIITGDHGEEFWEQNRFGHIYGLSKQQTQVIGVMRFPEKLNTQYTTTSHQDIFPTIFNYMSLNIDFEKYFSGKNLYEFDESKDFAVVALGTIGMMSRYTEAVISGDLKIEYKLKDKLEIVKISDDNDVELLGYNANEVSNLIKKSIAMKKLIPTEF